MSASRTIAAAVVAAAVACAVTAHVLRREGRSATERAATTEQAVEEEGREITNAPEQVAEIARPTSRSPPSPSLSPEDHDVRVRVDTRTDVRVEAHASAVAIASVPPGSVVSIVERRGGWAKIALRSEDGAWVAGWILFAGSGRRDDDRQPRSRGRATIAGRVSLTGRAPEMRVPVKRRDAEQCGLEDIVHDAVRGRPGRLADVIVRIAPGGVAGTFAPPSDPIVLDQLGCVYRPRVQGAVAGQKIEVRNGDRTLHNVHTYRGSESWFNQAQPKGAEPIRHLLEEDGIVRLGCDVHPWMRAFVVVSDHPFFAITGDDGSFTLPGVPAGTYVLESWHSHFGDKRIAGVVVGDGDRVDVSFEYDAADPEPPENRGELLGLW